MRTWRLVTLFPVGLAFLPCVPAWDQDVHRSLGTYALALAPDAVGNRIHDAPNGVRRLAEGIDYVEAPSQRGKLHGAHAHAELTRAIAEVRDSLDTMPPATLAFRLGIIAHLAADVFQPPRMRHCTIDERFLENHQVVFAYDPSLSGDRSDLTGAWQQRLAMLDPAGDLDTLRFDWAVSAIIDAWCRAAGADTGADYKPPVLILGRSTDWAPGGLGITRDESDALAHEFAMEDAARARDKAKAEYKEARKANEDSLARRAANSHRGTESTENPL